MNQTYTHLKINKRVEIQLNLRKYPNRKFYKISHACTFNNGPLIKI